MFKFGNNEFGEFVKNDAASRPVSAYTSGIVDQINDKFSKIVSSVKNK
jgi:hypothetical protein